MADAIADGIAAALDEVGGPGALDEPEAASGGNEPSKGEQSSTEDGEAEAVEDGTAEVPTEYWGVSLEGIPDEARAEVIAHFEQQDSTIRKLQAELAAAAETPETSPEEVPEFDIEQVSDEDLLRAAGYDPEDYEVQQQARFILPSLRRELALEDQLSRLVAAQESAAANDSWTRQLDELEATYGKLPVAREQVRAYAEKQGLTSPFEAYFKLAAPARKEVESAVAKARQEAARKAASGNLKPSGSKAGEPPIPDGLSLRDAVAAAAASAEKETGLSWKSIGKRR